MRTMRLWRSVGLLGAACVALLSAFSPSAHARFDASTGASCKAPYTANSPWNQRIRANAPSDSGSDAYVAAIAGKLSSDPQQYAPPVYITNQRKPATPVGIWGWFSEVTGGGSKLVNTQGGKIYFPLAAGQFPSEDTGQIVLVNPATGEEWGAFNLGLDGGAWVAQNIYRYSTRWNGVPPRSAAGGTMSARGSGLTYLGGLIRPCEISRGRIDHALAFSYDRTSPGFVYPATRSSGDVTAANALPQGARLQLDPALTEADLAERGCTDACLVIARALQQYGMIVVDRSGRPKLYVENQRTADWAGRLTEFSPGRIPISSFRVLSLRDALAPARAVEVGDAQRGGTLTAIARFTIAPELRTAKLTVLCGAADKRDFVTVKRAEPSLQDDGLMRATCVFDVPADAQGSRLEGSITLVHRRGGATANFVARLG